MAEEKWTILEQAIARDKARKYFTEVLPKIVGVIGTPAARSKFSQKNQIWLNEFVALAFSMQGGVIVGANLANVIDRKPDFYHVNQILLTSHQVPLQFSVDLLGNAWLQGIGLCRAHSDTQWALDINQTF